MDGTYSSSDQIVIPNRNVFITPKVKVRKDDKYAQGNNMSKGRGKKRRRVGRKEARERKRETQTFPRIISEPKFIGLFSSSNGDQTP